MMSSSLTNAVPNCADLARDSLARCTKSSPFSTKLRLHDSQSLYKFVLRNTKRMNKSQPAESEMALEMDSLSTSILERTRLINSDDVDGCLTRNMVTSDSMAATGMVMSSSSLRNLRYVSVMSKSVVILE